MRLIDADKLKIRNVSADYWYTVMGVTDDDIDNAPTVKAIPIDQLLSILPKYDDYIHTKTYPYNETMEDIYSQGYEDGWNVCLKHIKEELDYWEKENETN